MLRPRIDYGQVKLKILVMLYDAFAHDEPMSYAISDIAKFVAELENVTRVCVSELTSARKLVEGTRRVIPSMLFPNVGSKDDWTGDGKFTLTAAGRTEVEALEDAQYTELLKMLTYSRDEWGENKIHDEDVESDLSDDRWEPLQLDRSSDVFKQAIAATEEALSQIESNNGYAASDPDERNGIVESIRGGINTLKTGLITRKFIWASLITPLTHIVQKFAGSVVGEFAKAASEALVKLIFKS